jgi:hypothetical protein
VGRRVAGGRVMLTKLQHWCRRAAQAGQAAWCVVRGGPS